LIFLDSDQREKAEVEMDQSTSGENEKWQEYQRTRFYWTIWLFLQQLVWLTNPYDNENIIGSGLYKALL